jgi:hypothetical protein
LCNQNKVNAIDGQSQHQKLCATLSGVNAPAALREAAGKSDQGQDIHLQKVLCFAPQNCLE